MIHLLEGAMVVLCGAVGVFVVVVGSIVVVGSASITNKNN